MPTMAKSGGKYPFAMSRDRAGNSLRPARSPVAPNKTSVNGSGIWVLPTNGDSMRGTRPEQMTVSVDISEYPPRSGLASLAGSAFSGGAGNESFVCLLMRLHEPEPLVGAARDFGKQVGGVEIADFVGVVDGFARGLAECCQRRRKGLDMAATIDSAGRILAQRGSLRGHTGGAFRDAAELHRALGNVVNVILNILIDLVEQFVQGDEVGPLDVPVGLLGLRLQIDRIGEAGVEYLNGLDASFF